MARSQPVHAGDQAEDGQPRDRAADARAGEVISNAADVNVDFAVCLRLAAATGARRGELVALKRADFKGARLTTRRSLVESDDQLFERPMRTGNKGHRTIAVDALRVRQAAEVMARLLA